MSLSASIMGRQVSEQTQIHDHRTPPISAKAHGNRTQRSLASFLTGPSFHSLAREEIDLFTFTTLLNILRVMSLKPRPDFRFTTFFPLPFEHKHGCRLTITHKDLCRF